LLAKPSPLNINLGSDRFSMFNKKAGHPLRVRRDRIKAKHQETPRKAAKGNYEPAATAAITPIAIMHAAWTKKNAKRMAATGFICSNER
jgi:hypothetical protein